MYLTKVYKACRPFLTLTCSYRFAHTGVRMENRLLSCKLASLVSCRTRDKCVLNFKPCGMFGKELHKVEGYIQDKRYTCPPVSPATSFYSITCSLLHSLLLVFLSAQ